MNRIMKPIDKFFMCLLAGLLLGSCRLDNYDAPDAALSGTFIDELTGEPVQQDLINGTVIEYIESGYTAIEQMVVKNDGTYRNALMFSGEYLITPVRGNFEPLDPQTVRVQGETRLDFSVKPYIRLSDVIVFKNGDKVKASFQVVNTGYDKIRKIGLFVYPEPTVGASMFTVAVELPVGERYKEPHPFTLTIDIPSQPKLQRGQTYFFRVGAQIDVAEAKYNYAPAVRLEL